jgi:hypothetical protein
MPANIIVNLGNEGITNQVHERLEQELMEYDPSWQVIVECKANGIEIKVLYNTYVVHGLESISLDTVEKIVGQVAHMLKLASQQNLAS